MSAALGPEAPSTLAPYPVELVFAIGQIVSPDVPKPLLDTAHGVLRRLEDNPTDADIRDGVAVLDGLRATLGIAEAPSVDQGELTAAQQRDRAAAEISLRMALEDGRDADALVLLHFLND